MFKRILVPLDGSEYAERAIPVAARIARVSQGTIIFVRVLPPADLAGYAETKDPIFPPTRVRVFEKDVADATSYLTATIDAYADDLTGIPTEMDLAAGTIPPTIFSTARLEHVDLAVMCSRGITGLKRWLIGSVSQEAVRHSPVPILVLHEHGSTLPAPDATHPLRILVPLDGSVQSETVLEPAVQLLAAFAAPAGGACHLLRIVALRPPYGKLRSQARMSDSMQAETRQEAEAYLKVIADRLSAGIPADLGLTITTSVAASTDVVGTIIKTAEEADGPEHRGGYDLIAMATHGREGLQRLLMGSVTEHVLDATKLPVLIARPKEVEAVHAGTGGTMKMKVSEVQEQTWVGLF